MLIVGLIAAVVVAGSGVSTAYLLTKDKIPTEVLDVLTIEDKPNVDEPDLTPKSFTPPPPPPPPAGDGGGGTNSDDEEDEDDDAEDTDDDAGSSTDTDAQESQDTSSADSSDSADSQQSEPMSEQDLNELIVKLFKRIHTNHGSWSSKATVGGTYEMYSSILDLTSALEQYQKEKNKT